MRKLIYGAVTCLMAGLLLGGSQFIMPIFEPPVGNLTSFFNQMAGPPGPSASLLANPVVYTCVTNYYATTTGSDSANGSLATPWLTIQHADTLTRSPGDCINVAAGTYNWSSTFALTKGGNAASTTGYVTYRCQTLNACKIVFSGGTGGVWAAPIPYLVFDGFDLDGGEAATYGGLADACFVSSIPSTTTPGHHIWILNNKIHGCNLAGIAFQDSEFYFALHNEVFNNAWTSGFQGSGIGYVSLKRLGDNLNPYTAYTRTVQDTGFAPFNNIVAWNKVHDNGCTTCLGSTTVLTTTCNTHSNLTLDGCASTAGVAQFQLVTGPNGNSCIPPMDYVNTIVSGTITLTRPATCTQTGISVVFQTLTGGHTDGNGIIMDTFCGGAGSVSNCGGTGTQDYNYTDNQTLVAFNDVQFNGGRGVHLFAVFNSTAANNSTYRNGLDVIFTGLIGDLSQAGGVNNNWYNNIAFSVDTINTANCAGSHCNNTLVAGNGRGIVDTNIIYQHNVLFGAGGVSLFDNDASVPYFVNANNKPSSDPLYVNETSATAGDLHLQAGSPALGYAYTTGLSFLPLNTNNAGAYQ